MEIIIDAVLITLCSETEWRNLALKSDVTAKANKHVPSISLRSWSLTELGGSTEVGS